MAYYPIHVSANFLYPNPAWRSPYAQNPLPEDQFQ